LGAVGDFDVYQRLTRRTAGDLDVSSQLVNCALGLTGEAGEVADYLKKHLFQGHEWDVDTVVSELGDILWYIAQMADAIGWRLSDIAARNVEKLRKRYPDGFSVERSVNRE